MPAADEPKFVLTMHTFDMLDLDTGIGQDAGYANDKELIAAVEAERAALDPEVRETLEQFDRDVERKILGL